MRDASEAINFLPTIVNALSASLLLTTLKQYVVFQFINTQTYLSKYLQEIVFKCFIYIFVYLFINLKFIYRREDLVVVVTSLRAKRPRDRGSIPGWAKDFLLPQSSHSLPRTLQPPTQWLQGALSLGVNWPWLEANHWRPPSTEIKNEWSYTSTLPYTFMTCMGTVNSLPFAV
jgi:hypothetical protein